MGGYRELGRCGAANGSILVGSVLGIRNWGFYDPPWGVYFERVVLVRGHIRRISYPTECEHTDRLHRRHSNFFGSLPLWSIVCIQILQGFLFFSFVLFRLILGTAPGVRIFRFELLLLWLVPFSLVTIFFAFDSTLSVESR